MLCFKESWSSLLPCVPSGVLLCRTLPFQCCILWQGGEGDYCSACLNPVSGAGPGDEVHPSPATLGHQHALPAVTAHPPVSASSSNDPHGQSLVMW